MSTISAKIDLVLRSALVPLMKSQGFRRIGRDFSRQVDGSWLVLNVQLSRWNSSEEGDFTINLGVHNFEIAALVEKTPVNSTPKEYACLLRTRIGNLMADEHDHWWKVDSRADVDTLGLDVANIVRDLGLPWLFGHARIEQISEALRFQPSVWAAAAALAAGSKEEAARRVSGMIEARPRARETFESWARSVGL